MQFSTIGNAFRQNKQRSSGGKKMIKLLREVSKKKRSEFHTPDTGRMARKKLRRQSLLAPGPLRKESLRETKASDLMVTESEKVRVRE